MFYQIHPLIYYLSFNNFSFIIFWQVLKIQIAYFEENLSYKWPFHGNRILGWDQSETVAIIRWTPYDRFFEKSKTLRHNQLKFSLRIFHLTIRLFRLQRYLPINKYFKFIETSSSLSTSDIFYEKTNGGKRFDRLRCTPTQEKN